MKSSLATTLSMVGVIAAGAVAFTVNSTVLDNATTAAVVAPALQADVVVADAVTTVVETPSPVSAAAVPGEVAPAPIVAPAPVPAPAPVAALSQYNINGVGTVTLSQDATNLTVASVSPLNGYTFASSTVSPSRIAVVFTKDGATMTFNAELLDTRVVTSIVAHAAPQPSAPQTGQRHDDEDHEENEDYDNEEEEGEEDDD